MQDFMNFEHKDPTIESFEFLNIFEKAKNVLSPPIYHFHHFALHAYHEFLQLFIKQIVSTSTSKLSKIILTINVPWSLQHVQIMKCKTSQGIDAHSFDN
jgi:hypothetical protein